MQRGRHLPQGSRYGRWTVLGDGYTRNGNTVVPCVCECGTKRDVSRDALTSSHSQSCGCGKWKVPRMGERFDCLVVVAIEPRTSGQGNTRVICRCDCGTVKPIAMHCLKDGSVRSCGCNSRAMIAAARLKHGDSRGHTATPEYRVWRSMMQRCFCKTDGAYSNYGGRGITVCERWCGEHGYEHFLADMGRRPTMGHTLDRYPNNDGNYEPDNCRWATATEQGRNRRTNRMITFNGVSKCIAEWSEILSVSRDILRRRIEDGWNVDDALCFPVARNGVERNILTQLRRSHATTTQVQNAL